MKTLFTRSLLMIAVMSALTAANATRPADPLRANVPSAQERELKKQINQYVTYPLMERKREMDGEVQVSFVINSAGKVEVISAASENEALRAYVLRKLDRIDIGDNPSGTWKTEHMRFVFRPEA
ncbi:MAG: energy transducer TonB [Flavobacteriales bacterium]|nr:energy transducer TonB [Flavobacteriales bacterium]